MITAHPGEVEAGNPVKIVIRCCHPQPDLKNKYFNRISWVMQMFQGFSSNIEHLGIYSLSFHPPINPSIHLLLLILKFNSDLEKPACLFSYPSIYLHRWSMQFFLFILKCKEMQENNYWQDYQRCCVKENNKTFRLVLSAAFAKHLLKLL